MRLSQAEKQEFLAAPHVGVIAVPEPDGPPLAVPIWYHYTPGGDAWVLTGSRSRKAAALRSTGRCTLVAQTVEPRVRYVSVACRVVEERPSTPDDQRAMASRYLQGDALEGYLEHARDDEALASEVVVVLRPTQWLGADLTLG
ncbi:pyridoxamine 5-phosphate oxidase [Desertihabitans brevis]|uniref:Pyridoxamine 5-phosphate oxidase n=1 Tax=Desertihabitans brevis TaxID=2268447 RepID=A0A367YYU7_9ACTN|nr:pyridoxamine 5'-phosphate oxidase family protein [Desertihabitans brevis]RCK70877.1 pyridoxamine 5-phosphate oxidase [Desertihabitans brevis]